MWNGSFAREISHVIMQEEKDDLTEILTVGIANCKIGKQQVDIKSKLPLCEAHTSEVRGRLHATIAERRRDRLCCVDRRQDTGKE